MEDTNAANSTAESAPVVRATRKVYSVPRRYDLATLFAVSLAYAFLFGVMRIFNADPVAVALVAGFVTAVGLSQALLFRGNAPRAASMVAGASYWIVGLIIYGALRGLDPLLNLVTVIYGASYAVIAGSIAGYFGGVFVGAVFMFADFTRKFVQRFAGH